ncbi:N-acetylmuramoyl-L-alanine amidase LytC precursor [Oxobacter pfennigii]|uniref:N-acetylmuramoyl-L-alanine amidase LytC n=1 Tax=Oxobacter pfennigii TaxID=36849 RepID=A0A0N8NT28_9CLOT|nr:cell wall-binding repeat-containing protein [Oxobacter pfennigii]KPU43672.1 N-acetylmuramoyl-L-alanine amidase LytC precursor [Oxobacter pfennigii]
MSNINLATKPVNNKRALQKNKKGDYNMFRKSKKLLALALVVSMILTQVLFTSTALAATASRLSGADRYETALRISQSNWTDGSTDYAVLAYGEDFPDALSAAPLAKKYNAPILLTAKDSLPAGVLNELNRLGVENVFIVGGEGVVSATVASALTAAGKTVTRLAGASRYETALKVAEQVGESDTVVVANGEGFADALSIAPIAAAKGWPILLTDANAMDAAVKAYIGSKKVFVVGGAGVVADAAVAGLNVERLSGADRYATNVAIMAKFAADLNFAKVFVATGEGFADALAGSVPAAVSGSPVVLAGATLAAGTQSFLNGVVPSTAVAVVLGGPAVVSDAVAAAIGSPSSEVLAITGVTTLTQDGRGIRISFNKPIASLTSADVTVYNKSSLATIGVESVSLSSNKMTADIWFLEDSTNSYAQTGKTYVIEVVTGGSTLKYEYIRANYASKRVIDVDASEAEIKLADIGTLIVPDDIEVDYEDLLGRTADVWYDNSNFISKITPGNPTIKYDAVEINDDGTITLVDEDEDYDFADGATVIVDRNDTYTVDIDDETNDYDIGAIDDATYGYGKVVLNKSGDVVFLIVYQWEDFMVVEGVDGTDILGYGDVLDAEDYTIVKDGKTVAVDDLEEGDILFYTSDALDGDGFAEVFNKTVTGAIEDITDVDFTVDGEIYKYDVDYDKGSVQYLNDDELAALDAEIAEEFQDTEEEVVVYLDRAGDVVYITGERGDAVKTTIVGYLYEDVKPYNDTRSGDAYLPVDIINELGEKVSYDVKVSSLDKDTETNIKNTTTGALIMSTDDLATPSVDESTIVAGLAAKDLVQIKLNSDGDIVELYKIPSPTLGFTNITSKVETDDTYAAGSRLSDSTVIFLVDEYLSSNDEDDIEVIKLGDVTSFTEITAGTVYYNNSQNAKYIVATAADTDSDATWTPALITKVSSKITSGANKGSYRVTAFVDGTKEDFYTSNASSVETHFDGLVTSINAAISARGFYAAKLLIDDETGKIVNKGSGSDAVDVLEAVGATTETVAQPTTATVLETRNTSGNGTVTAEDGTVYRLASAAEVFDGTTRTSIKSISLSKIDADGDKAILFYDSVEHNTNYNFVLFVIKVN